MTSGRLSNTIVPSAGVAAVVFGLLFLNATGAPPRMLLINLVALGVGIALVAIARLIPRPSHAREGLLLGSAVVLIATALFGIPSEGASRWISLGGLSLQPGLILVPALLLSHLGQPNRWSSAAVALAAVAMALQPDRSLAAVIAVVALLDAAFRRSPTAWLVAAVSFAALAAALLQPDRLPAVPHVDQLLWTSVTDQPLAATSIWLGTALLFVPALVLWLRNERHLAAGFAMLWGGLVLSALAGNYPTPLVGYGASCILGYLLCTLALPRPASKPGTASGQTASSGQADTSPPDLRVAPATV